MESYQVKTQAFPARPRSKRRRISGQVGVSGIQPVVVPTPEGGHTHDNKDILDSMSVDENGYLLLQREVDGQTVVEKVKAGTADETVSGNFEPGMLGAGHRVWTDPESGESFAEVDHLSVRKTMSVYELVIQQVRHQGGVVIFSPAGMECTAVEETASGYKCYFDTKNGTVPNGFVAGDQARCQRFEMETLTAKYYWRLVTAVGVDYIVLSASDCDTGSGVPEAGDIIIQCGNRTDTTRQSAKITKTIGMDAPRDEYYSGINNYTLTDRLVTIVGVKDGKVGIYTSEGEFAGKITATSGKIGGFQISESAIKNLVKYAGSGRAWKFLNLDATEMRFTEQQDDSAGTTLASAVIGTQALPSSVGKILGYLFLKDGGYAPGGTIGLMLEVEDAVIGSAHLENHALLIRKGDVAKFNHHDNAACKAVFSNRTQYEWHGTEAEYNALPAHYDDTTYYIEQTSDNG